MIFKLYLSASESLADSKQLLANTIQTQLLKSCSEQAFLSDTSNFLHCFGKDFHIWNIRLDRHRTIELSTSILFGYIHSAIAIILNLEEDISSYNFSTRFWYCSAITSAACNKTPTRLQKNHFLFVCLPTY